MRGSLRGGGLARDGREGGGKVEEDGHGSGEGGCEEGEDEEGEVEGGHLHVALIEPVGVAASEDLVHAWVLPCSWGGEGRRRGWLLSRGAGVGAFGWSEAGDGRLGCC